MAVYDLTRQNQGAFVVNFTPTGMVASHEHNPHVPIHPDQIIRDVQEAVALGITMVHLHARNPDGSPSHDPNLYAEIIDGVRGFAPDLVICVSLSGRAHSDFETRSAPLSLDGRLKPDMGSLTLSSLNFSRQASMNAPDMIKLLAGEMLSKGVVPELEVFDGGMINYARYLIGRGIVEPPCYFNLILGNVAGVQADPLSLGTMLAQLPNPCLWSVGGIGAAQGPASLLGLASGGGVRIGLEDNLYLDASRTRLASNRDLLLRIHEIAERIGRRVMTAAEFRSRMGLLPGRGRYGRRAEAPPAREASL